MSPRYGVYFAPAPDSALWRFGSAVIGYDAAAGLDVEQATPSGWDPAVWRGATTDPRRYGFHATLKAPFRLREGAREGDLLGAFRDWAARLRACPPVPLTVAALSDFVALVPADSSACLSALAESAVDAFEPLRAPLTADEVARRRPELLTPRLRELLALYGYPYVREAFSFHMTLSNAVGARAPELAAALGALHRATCGEEAVPIDRVALFRQDSPDARFVVAAAAELAP